MSTNSVLKLLVLVNINITPHINLIPFDGTRKRERERERERKRERERERERNKQLWQEQLVIMEAVIGAHCKNFTGSN